MRKGGEKWLGHFDLCLVSFSFLKWRVVEGEKEKERCGPVALLIIRMVKIKQLEVSSYGVREFKPKFCETLDVG